MKTDLTSLQSLQNLINKNPRFDSYLNIDLKNTTLIAEFSIYNYSTFSLFHCNNSLKYILYIKIDEEFVNFFDKCYSKKYFINESIEESMESINNIIRLYFWEPGGGELIRWWSYLPEWMYVNPYSISTHFHQFVQKTVAEIMAEINENDLTKTEKAAINNWRLFL